MPCESSQVTRWNRFMNFRSSLTSPGQLLLILYSETPLTLAGYVEVNLDSSLMVKLKVRCHKTRMPRM